MPARTAPADTAVSLQSLHALLYMLVRKQMILAIFVVAVAFRTETELQARIVLFRPAADRAFMPRSFSSAFVCFSLKLSPAVHLFRRDAAFVHSVKV